MDEDGKKTEICCRCLQLWTSAENLLGNTLLVFLEVLDELGSEGADRVLIRLSITDPSLARIQNLIRNTVASLWNGKVENWKVLVLGVLKGTVVYGVEDGTSVSEWTSLTARGGTSTNPAGVDEPCVGGVFRDLGGEHLCVSHWVESKEGLAEAGGEGGLWLGDTFFGSGHLGGVAGDEVVGDGAGVELGDWWENTRGVAGEEDQVAWVSVGDAWELDVGNIFEWVRSTGVLGEGGVVVVDLSGEFVKDDVLENGTVSDGTKDLWFLFGAEADALGVATTFDVEDTGVGPAVLVVTDQGSLWVGRESGLSSSRETEEDSDVSVLALVGGRVEGEDIVVDWHFVEHDSEDTLLHLTSVLGTKDNHLLLGKVESDGGRGSHASSVLVGWEAAAIVDGPVGVEVLELFGTWSDKHVSHEQGMVGTGTDNSDVDSVAGIPSGVSIDNVDSVTSVQVVDSTFSVDSPCLRLKRLVMGGSCQSRDKL